MNIAKTIKYLRKQIPSFECKPDCTDCCGPVPFSKWEWEQIKDKRKTITLNCPYASENGCEIYEQRPILCRLFGTVPKIKCPHGCGPKKMLSRKKETEIMRKYNRIMDAQEAVVDKIDSILLNKETDVKIREALRSADRKGKLSVVAAVIGIAGGEKELRKIMNSKDGLHIMDRGMIGMHLDL